MKPHEHIIMEIARERERQISVEGWTPQHDDSHDNGELAQAAACYALGRTSIGANVEGPVGESGKITASIDVWIWPWLNSWWKPKRTRSNLIRAAALIVAEIERLDRAAAKGGKP